MSNSSRYTSAHVVALVLAAFSASTIAQELACGSLNNHFGPFDYRTARAEDKNMVERAHFTPKVENLIRGHTSLAGRCKTK